MRGLRIPILLAVLLVLAGVYFRYELQIVKLYALAALGKSSGSGQNAETVLPWTRIKLGEVASGLALPVYLTHAGDGSGRIFIVEKPGAVRILKDGKLAPKPFLDIQDRVRSRENERGLLSIAFHPRHKENGRFFVNYTDLSGGTVVSEFKLGGANDEADPKSERVIVKIAQPKANHNGGQIQFGRDGYLYIGTGDGGGGGDPWENAENKRELLGKMLRIDVDGKKPYAIPQSNPFVGQGGAKGEIWALGLRNPWRFSFDRATGDMYIADVGQNRWEEIHFQPASSKGGENYGWDLMEGFHPFELEQGQDASGLTMPVAEYSHDVGCSVTGGYVYRGKQHERLAGTYLFADFCSGVIWGLRKNPNGVWEQAELLRSGMRVSSFGEDEAGEIYALDYQGGVFRIETRERE